MALTNKALNTGSVTNIPLPAHSLTWAEALFSWNAAVGPWIAPYTLSNTDLHTASMANNALSP